MPIHNRGLVMPPTGEAVYDPDPENNMGTDVLLIGKEYHFSWDKKQTLVLHKGFSMKCRKAHYTVQGARFKKPKAEK